MARRIHGGPAIPAGGPSLLLTLSSAQQAPQDLYLVLEDSRPCRVLSSKRQRRAGQRN